MLNFDGPLPDTSSVDLPKSYIGMDNSVAEWFSRPVLISTLPWNEGGTVSGSIPPLAYLFDKTITSYYNKMIGYSRLRCKLHVRVQLNASPFHYGAINVSWAPLTTEYGNGGTSNPYDAAASFSSASLSSYYSSTFGVDYDLMRQTQRMNQWLFPQLDNTVDFEIPWIFPKEYIEIPNSNTETNADLNAFGSLTFRTPVPLTVAQANTGGICTINVYAWLSEVEVAGPTYKLTSGMLQEASQMVSNFKDTPIIGTYAKRGGAIMKASAKVMELLGFSNPPCESHTVVATQVAPHLTSTEIPSCSDYMGLAKSSGLSLTPESDPMDELLIEKFGNSFVYLGTSTWTQAATINSSVFTANVTPEYFLNSQSVPTSASLTAKAIATIPSAYISSMFSKWKGVVCFRFICVASQYHRGRLRLYYDSNGSITLPALEGTTFSKMWDITETSEFEYEIPFQSATELLTLLHPHFDPIAKQNHTNAGVAGTIGTYVPFAHNGFVNLAVANSLMGPSNSNAYILCFARIKDLELAEPCTIGESYPTTGAFAVNTSNPVYTGFQLTTPYAITSGLDLPVQHRPYAAEDYIGEKVLSLRTLLHRPAFYTTVGSLTKGCNDTSNGGGESVLGNSTGAVIKSYINIPRTPVSPGDHGYKVGTMYKNGPYANNFHRTVGDDPITYAHWTPFTFLKPMFAGYRGSFRYRVLPDARPNISNPMHVLVSGVPYDMNFPDVPSVISVRLERTRDGFGESVYTDYQSGVGKGTAPSVIAYNMKVQDEGSSGLLGASFNSIEVGGIVTGDFPQYSRYKFLPTNEIIYSGNATSGYGSRLSTYSILTNFGRDTIGDLTSDGVKIQTDFTSLATTGGNTARTYHTPSLKLMSSTGTDFSFVAFLNTPILFLYPGGTTPLPAKT